MTLSRRRFVSLAGAAFVGGGLALPGCRSGSRGDDAAGPTPGTAGVAPTPGLTPGSTAEPVLVVVQLGGGNDGLNTLVPTGSAAGRYRDARPTLAVAEEELVPLAGTDEYGLHPALAPLAPLWDAGQLAALQAIGLPEQSRSHFVALDTWWSGGPGPSSGGGWLGRWLDATTGAEPDPMRAISLAGGSPALLGSRSAPIVVQAVEGFSLADPGGRGTLVDAFEAMAAPPGSGLLAEAQAAIPVAVESVAELQAAFRSGEPAGRADAPGALFGAVADIVEADLGTQVIVVNLGGFDTHANQPGQHRALLGNLGAGVAGLFERLEGSGHASRTLLVAYSEFGRRVAQNGSLGTDHGNGGLALMAGPGLASGQVVGELDLVNLDRGDVPRTVDARSLYANALDWLGGPTAEVLGGDWDTYGLLT